MMDRMDIVSLLLGALATARLTRIVTTDRITEEPRRRALELLRDHKLLSYLLVCDWCVSVYTGAAVAGTWWAWGDTTAWAAATAVLAFSHTAGFLAGKEGTGV